MPAALHRTEKPNHEPDFRASGTGEEHSAAVAGAVRTVAHIDRLEGRQTASEISVARLTMRVTMWATVGVTVATLVIQIAFKFVG